jgi:outer membrane murein-binding lipoprotein Lpp
MSELTGSNNNDRYEEVVVEKRPSWQTPAIIVLGLAALGGLGFGWNATAKLDSTQQSVANQLKTQQDSVQQDVSAMRERLAQDEKANADLQGDLKVVTDKLKITQGQLKKAREESTKANADTTEKLTALDTSMKGELATKASSDDVKTVDTKVVGVKTDLDATREDLKMARSEIGTLIARNHDEIDQLRRLGERDYIEFTVTGKNKPQKVGNVTVELKGVNEKHNQYSLAMTVEDKRFEKKNRALNEPILFYTSGTHQAEEVVINKVGKDHISGYLSVPKANAPGSGSTNSGK